MTKRNSSAGCPKTICVICSRSWINYRMGPFWENQLFVFWGAQKTFLSPQNLIWPWKPHFWGGHTSKTFQSVPWFWRYPGLIWPKNSYFETLKPLLRSKSFRSMTPPKVRFLRPNKVLGAQKRCLGPPKHKKIDFLKKLDLSDLAAHSWELPQYPVPRYHFI